MVRLVEVSFEIGNKVGGIHTVIRSKLQEILKVYKDDYLAVGFFNKEKSPLEFEPGPLPFDIPEISGIKIYTGKWFGANAVLIDSSGLMGMRNDIKRMLWEKHGVDSLTAGPDFDEPVVWGWAVSRFLESLQGRPILHFHEWLAGTALLCLDKEFPTVFTTHATTAGRTIAGNGLDLYEIIRGRKEFESLLRKFNTIAKHHVEKVSAAAANIFTTVSEATAIEAEYFLGRKVDKVLPNGISTSNYPSMEELYYEHKKSKEKIKDFLRAYFGPYMPLKLEDPRIIVTSGRYEFRNKGYDILIRALGKAERELDTDREVFVFFLVPSDTRGEKKEVIDNIMSYGEIKDISRRIGERIREDLPNAIINNDDIGEMFISIAADFRAKIKAVKMMFKKDGKPPICSHELGYPEENDPIIRSLLAEGLDNSPERKIKVVFYPVYIRPGDRLIDIETYDEFLRGCSAGIFPSYYEPWGYTPVEAGMNGLVSVTTNLSGFGMYLREPEGMVVIDRTDDSKAVEQLAETIKRIATIPKSEIGDWKAKCRKDAEKVDWSILIRNYLEVYGWLENETGAGAES